MSTEDLKEKQLPEKDDGKLEDKLEEKGESEEKEDSKNINGKDTEMRSVKNVTCSLCFAVFAAVSGTGLVFGYNTGVLNNPMDNIKSFFNETKFNRSGEPFSNDGLTWYWAACVAIWALFAIGGCFFGGFLCAKLGSRKTMLLNNTLLLIGTLLQSCCKPAKSYEMFMVGRAIMGVNNGVCTSSCPLYLSEIAPKFIRGAVGVVFQFTIVFGILLAQILGFEHILGSQDLWPYLIGINLALGAVQCLTLPFCPESPRYLLILRGDREAARNSLQKLRGEAADIEEEIKDMIEEDRREKEEPKVRYLDLWIIKYLRRPLIIACVLAMSQQLSGINAIFYYSSPIFKAILPADLILEDSDYPKYMVSIVGFVNLIFTIVAVFTIEPLGRKKSHLIGLAGMAACILPAAILLSGLETSEDQTCHGVTPSKTTDYIAMALIFLSVAFFSIGPGPVPWLICAELFTSSARPKALSIANTVNWLCNFMIALGFEPLINELCGWVFLIFFVLLVIFTVYTAIKVPKTDGKTVNEIVEAFKDMDKKQNKTAPIAEDLSKSKVSSLNGNETSL